MTDGDAAPTNAVLDRFAALVALVAERPSDAMVQRDAARAVTEAAKATPLTLALVDGALQADGAPAESPLIAARFKAYGIEELGITAKASQADLLDLARLLAAAPGDGDPVARFAARAAVLDPKALPRRLRQRTETVESPAPSPAPPGAPAPRKSTPAIGASSVPTPATPATPDAAATPRKRVSKPSDEESPSASPPPEPRDAPVRLVRALEIPKPSDPQLAAAIDAVEVAAVAKELTAALDQFVTYCDIAFRQGRHDALVEGVAAVVAVEYAQLERDGADERRQAFNHAIRRLARPVLLRQLATLRHTRAGTAIDAERLQQALYRFGVDAAEAMLDEATAAATAEARATCIDSLRGLPRAIEALAVMIRDQNELTVRNAVATLGAIGGAPAERLLDKLLEHPEWRVRRDVAASLGRLGSDGSFESLAFLLGDGSAAVRVRAVSALALRKDARLLGLLDPVLKGEADREVLFAAVDALGRLGTAEAVQALIAIAQGQGTNPQRDAAPLRIQACIALVAIRSPQAMAAVQVLRDDKDREVRQASMRLVAHARRRPTTSTIAAVSEP